MNQNAYDHDDDDDDDDDENFDYIKTRNPTLLRNRVP